MLDLGVGHSTLNKWVQKHQNDDLMSGPHEDVENENERLRKEVWLRREEREVLKKAAVGSTDQRNIFDLRCSERTYDGTNWSPWIVARAEG